MNSGRDGGYSMAGFLRISAVLLIILSGCLTGGQKPPQTEAGLHYPILSHADWWQSQYGLSRKAWTDAFGANYRNENSGPACAVMVIKYKKRARISADLNSFSDPEYPRVRTDVRWKFCRANTGKGYPGGFADDDGAEVSGSEMVDVLEHEDIPVVVHSGKREAALDRIAEAIGRTSLVICRVDPSLYFSDEKPGDRRWVVVYGIDRLIVSVNDPGRPEGKTKRIARGDFLAALQKAGGETDPILLECVVMVGNYSDGWHADGRSRMFVDYYKGVRSEIGFPFDNGGSSSVHTVGLCVVQDYLKPAAAPSAAKAELSLLVLNQAMIRVFWIHGAIFEKYFSVWGFEKLGSPISDEYPVPGGRRQDFEKGNLTWNGKEATVKIDTIGKKN